MQSKLSQLKSLMEKYNIDFLLIHNQDEFQSQYVPKNLQRVKWLCNFSGSNATLIITKENQHHFFTDGRYLLQATIELDSNNYTINDITKTKPHQWLRDNTLPSSIVGYEAKLFTLTQIKSYIQHQFTLKPITEILIDDLWKRPLHFSQLVSEYNQIYSGVSSSNKISKLLQKFEGYEALLITDIESISWLLNIRNTKFQYIPAALCRAILFNTGLLYLFIDKEEEFKVHNSLIKYYNSNELIGILNNLTSISIDSSTISMYLFNTIKHKNLHINIQDPCVLLKAQKNSVEIKGAINAHIYDGIAVVNFLFWLYSQLITGQQITEISAEKKLLNFRQQSSALFQGESFATISAFAEHAAIIHYKANEKTNKTITGNGLYLIDSGGQYLNGTTDITRTILIGRATAEQIDNFTRVLKGHIALATSIFPVNTNGGQLDILARQYLWQVGLNYNHSTGHGVGHFLSVHEGPQSISQKNNIPLLENMILSNEPGYYSKGKYGIRIENLMYISRNNSKNEFLRFKQLTCVPIDKSLININMLSKDEISYINNYHQFVYDSISEKLAPNIQSWLSNLCQAIY